MVKQAIERVCRLGQQKVVLVYDYHVEKSFDITLVLRNKLKAIPGLVVEIPDHVPGEFIERHWDCRDPDDWAAYYQEQPPINTLADGGGVLQSIPGAVRNSDLISL